MRLQNLQTLTLYTTPANIIYFTQDSLKLYFYAVLFKLVLQNLL